MGKIEKGIILTIEGVPDRDGNATKASVQSTSAVGTSTLPLTIPWYLRGSMGELKKGTEVVYSLFDDMTGIILSRMDGNWNGIIDGSITAGQIISNGINLASHVHGGVEAGNGSTTAPRR